VQPKPKAKPVRKPMSVQFTPMRTPALPPQSMKTPAKPKKATAPKAPKGFFQPPKEPKAPAKAPAKQPQQKKQKTELPFRFDQIPQLQQRYVPEDEDEYGSDNDVFTQEDPKSAYEDEQYPYQPGENGSEAEESDGDDY
jgi:hypothetical protein